MVRDASWLTSFLRHPRHRGIHDCQNRRKIVIVPTTRSRCHFSLAVGVLLLCLELTNLATDTVSSHFLAILTGVLTVLMIACAVIGLAFPATRRR
jgi:hypothetical protein